MIRLSGVDFSLFSLLAGTKSSNLAGGPLVQICTSPDTARPVVSEDWNTFFYILKKNKINKEKKSSVQLITARNWGGI